MFALCLAERNALQTFFSLSNAFSQTVPETVSLSLLITQATDWQKKTTCMCMWRKLSNVTTASNATGVDRKGVCGGESYLA